MTQACDRTSSYFPRFHTKSHPTPPLHADMRPEAFTQLKDQRMKDMGAEIITVDQQYRPGSGAGEGSTGPAQGQVRAIQARLGSR